MNNETAVNKMQEPELLNEVPPILKRLAKTVAYAFYENELVVTISLLTKYPCIDEDTLIEKLQFDRRQMRQALSRLKNDKLIKQRVIKEKQPDTGNFNIYNFYFINYKIFVNVVKYKLDHVRRKLETEEQQVRNRPSFQCQDCESHYSDLEVDRLIDFTTGEMKCTFCSGNVEEDPTQMNSLETGSSLGKFNEQMETIFNLLKECEHINLAPEVLEPTPSTEGLKQTGAKTHASTKGGWSTDKKSIDLYDQRIQINVGDEVEKNNIIAAPKEMPAWITHSTVFEENAPENIQNPLVSPVQSSNIDDSNMVSNDIMTDLLAHESEKKKPHLETPLDESHVEGGVGVGHSSNPEIIKLADAAAGITEVADMADSDEDDDDDDDESNELSVKVGDVTYALSDITDEILEKMTVEERQNYLKVYNDMCDQFY